MSARDRIRAVAETLREPRSVNWISEQADAAWSTTNEELQDLVDQGQLRRVEAGETTRYQPDYTRLLFEEIRTLIEANTREELRSELAAITKEIEEAAGNLRCRDVGGARTVARRRRPPEVPISTSAVT